MKGVQRDIFEVIKQRRTTNGYFLDKPLAEHHIKMLMEAASCAPSHFNSQPWRFVLIRDAERRKELGKIAGQSMRVVMEKGHFWKRYLKYFRFSKEEIEKSGDGIYIDNMPAPLKPFIRYLFSEKGGEMMNKLRVPWILAIDSKKLVASSPLILGVLLSKDEYKPEEKSGMYCLLALGMAIENIWLAATALDIGVQFISLPMEAGGEYWQKCMIWYSHHRSMNSLPCFALDISTRTRSVQKLTGQASNARMSPNFVTKSLLGAHGSLSLMGAHNLLMRALRSTLHNFHYTTTSYKTNN